jgi:hypothetical protein
MGRAMVWQIAGVPALPNLGGDMRKAWWIERAREPSTYQGLSVLAGLLGQWCLGSAEAGQQALQVGMAVAALIQVGKVEALPGRDFDASK